MRQILVRCKRDWFVVAALTLNLAGCAQFTWTSKISYNGLAKTPPMGWNSWNHFGAKIDDQTVRSIADAMVSSGMRDAGYLYVNIDDSWAGGRDAQGNIQPKCKIPGHESACGLCAHKGPEVGAVFIAGSSNLCGYTGSYKHEQQDANTFVAWGSTI